MTSVSERVAFALEHPLNNADVDVAPYRDVTEQRDGNLLCSVLAVDR